MSWDCGTTIKYRGIQLRNCQTREFRQDLIYDDSNTDLLYHKYSVSVAAIVHGEDAASLGANFDTFTDSDEASDEWDHLTGNDAYAADRLLALQDYLLVPRGAFHMWHCGAEVLAAKGAGGLFGENIATAWPNFDRDPPFDVDTAFAAAFPNAGSLPTSWNAARKYAWYIGHFDVRNGPKPISVKVTHIAGSNCYHVDFNIEICTMLIDQKMADDVGAAFDGILPEDVRHAGVNLDADGNKNYVRSEHELAVLSNRWKIDDTRDKDFMWTKTYSGKLVLRSAAILPHSFRYLCVPQLPRGFQRQKMQFTTSEDGLTMTYQIVDKQRYAAPPRPAIDWRASQVENVQNLNPYVYTTIDIWLRGTASGSKKDLLQAALAVIAHRLGDPQEQDNDAPTTIPVDLTVIDTLHEPEVRVVAKFERVFDEDKKKGDANHFERWANLIVDDIGKLPAVNFNQAGIPAGDPDGEARNDNTEESEDSEDGDPIPQYNRDAWPNPNIFDSKAPVGMLANYLQHPGTPVHAIPVGVGELGDQTDVIPDRYLEAQDDPLYDEQSEYTIPEGNITVYKGDNISLYNPRTPQTYDVWSESHRSFMYTSVEAESKYYTDYHVNTHSLSNSDYKWFTRLGGSGGTTYRVYWIRAKRYGKWPEMPKIPEYISRIDEDDEASEASMPHPQEVLVDYKIAPSPPQLTANGKIYLFELEYEITYACAKTPESTDYLKVGHLPWDRLDITSTASGTQEKVTYRRKTSENNKIIKHGD